MRPVTRHPQTAGRISPGHPPGFLVVGHVTRDINDGREYPGGTALYASLTLARLGTRPAVVTSTSSTLALRLARQGVEVWNLPTESVTTFHNRYHGEHRTQRLPQVAPALRVEQLPRHLRLARCVLLAPVAGEVGPEWTRAFPTALVALSAQGWARRRNARGHVHPVLPPLERAHTCHLAFLSLGDLPGQRIPPAWKDLPFPILLTEGSRGALLLLRGRAFRVPAFPAERVVDVTGAGDVFAASFLVEYMRTGDVFGSALFASASASVKVEGRGPGSVPHRTAVLRRLAQYPERRVARIGGV